MRTKQALSKKECFGILKDSFRGVLSLNTEEGYPYGLPLNHLFIEEENRLYFHSGKTGHKIECMIKDERCSYCVIKEIGVSEDGWSRRFLSVIAFGRIGFVKEMKEIERLSRKLSHKFGCDESYIDFEISSSLNATAMFYIDIEHITGKRVNEK